MYTPIMNVNVDGESDVRIEEESEGSSTSLTCGAFSIKNARRLIAEMIILDEIPFKFVEGKGFRRLMEGTLCLLEPRFVIPSRTTIIKDVMTIYAREKHLLKDVFVREGYRVSLTTDTWTSLQNISYMVLTAYYIDSDWKMQKKILNFCQTENHKGETIGKEIERCLKDWDLHKIMSLIVDNASSDDTVIDYLVKRLKNSVLLDGEFLQVSCCAHILNLIVCDVMEDMHESISRIRNAVHFVRSSPARFKKFKEMIQAEKISSKSLVCLDVPTRWNSTFMMLEAAEKFKTAFDRLKHHDMVYATEDTPSSIDWDVARVFIELLSLFNAVTLKLSGTLYVTSNMVFIEMTTIQDCIKKLASHDNGNFLLQDMASRTLVKFDKYWGNYEKTNILFLVAAVLDPRFKMKILTYYFNECYDANVAREMCKRVEDVLRRMFHEYSASNNPSSRKLQKTSIEIDSQTTPNTTTSSKLSGIPLLSRWVKGLNEIDTDGSPSAKSELDIYLLEICVRYEDNFDILDWWKKNSNPYRFKILSKIARDILAIPVSTFAPESAFSTGRRIIDSYRSSLAPTTLEALVCTQSWLHGTISNVDLQQDVQDVVNDEEEFKTTLHTEERRDWRN